MAYTPPAGNNANFNFTETGYAPAAPHNFNFGVGAGTSDLLASIVATAAGGQANLSGYIKSVIQATKNLGAYIKPTIQAYSDLVAAIRRFDQDDDDLGGDIHGWQPEDLGAEIGAHPPADLLGSINIIELRNLNATINGIVFDGSADLGARVNIFQSTYTDLPASITSNLLLSDLAASIGMHLPVDLPAAIRSVRSADYDLSAYLTGWDTGNLGALLHGWDERFLSASIEGVGSYDIQASISPIPGQDLSAIITGWKGFQIPIDLPASVSSWAITDLNAVISLIEAVDLGASITAIGKLADLGATIIPKTILMKRALQISLLEHKDMKAVINFQCFGSGYSNLGASMYTIYKAELRAFITGWISGTPDTIKNLGAYINAAGYYVEDVFTINMVPDVHKYTQLNINFSVGDVYITFDTLDILYGSFFGANLSATINGILTSYDLGAEVTPVIQTNYTELPENVNPKTHEVVIDFNDRWRENWRRFVELMFQRDGAEPFHYFYVKGSNTIYRVDRDRHWTIWADSYLNTEDDMIERRDIRQKYIFNMSNYSTVDEAVRDLIDRVSTYRRASLGASITGEWAPMADLSAYIEPKVKYSWVKHLTADLDGRVRFYIGTETLDLSASITGS